MKKHLLKLLAISTFVALPYNTFADPIADLMRSGVTDIDKMANVQLSPLGNSISAGLGGGWYNTAKPHKLFGFDLTLTVNAAIIPNEEKLFDFSKQGFKALQLANPNADPIMPTLIASDEITGSDIKLVFPEQKALIPVDATFINAFNTYNTLNPNNKIQLPQNVQISGNNIEYTMAQKESGKPIQLKGFVPSAVPLVAFPVPSLQFAIGLPKSTEIALRWVPEVDLGIKMGLWGFAVKHDYKQWIPGFKDVPIDATVLFGYTKFSSTYALSVTPDLYGDIQNLAPNSTRWDNQQMALSASAFTTNFIFSKSLLIFTPYIGLGFTATSFNLAMEGNYPLLKAPILDSKDPNFINPVIVTTPTQAQIAQGVKPSVSLNPDFGKFVVDDKIEAKNQADGTFTSGDYMKDPIKINPSQFMPNATIGLRIKLAILTLHAQYTVQKYPMITAGLGFSFR